MSERKPNSIVKRHARYSRGLLRQHNLMVAWVAGQNDNKCVLINARSAKTVLVTPELHRAIADVQHDWSVFCGVFGRRQDGQEYMTGEVVLAPRCYQSAIADVLSEQHTQILRRMNPMHRVGLGWIACPWGEDISEDRAAKLFDAQGGWDADIVEIEEMTA